jgi:cytoskeleton protein RodZ
MNDEVNSDTDSVGSGLRAVRERLGWKLPDVAASLNIRREFLEAIEAGQLQSLPGPAYRTGFVRSYARMLGLDADEILRRFREAGALPDAKAAEMRFISTVPDRGVPRGAIVLVGVVVVLVAYGLWYHYSDSQRRLAEQVPMVPAELAPLATPPKIDIAPVIPAPAQQAAQTPAPAAPPPATAPAATDTSAAAAPAATAPQPPGAGMVISATEDSWVEVQDASGNILFSKVLHPGDSWPVPQEAGLTLTSGNAGGTLIVTNGQAGQPLGAPSSVLHGYQLTPPATGTAQNVAAPAAASIPAPPPKQVAPASGTSTK